MSEYGETSNIVLVGDPGAGKSHLFEELAQAAKTIVRSARAFLNMPPGSTGATLFIDALDTALMALPYGRIGPARRGIG